MTEAAETTKTLEIGVFGQFLKDNGIESKRLPDSLGVETIQLNKEDLEQSMRLLKNSSEINLNLLLSVCGVDYADKIESVYHLWSYQSNNELVIKIDLSKDELHPENLPTISSLSTFWHAANWHERETYDLVGIRFLGHPYLRRILNPWDWEGHPLRRDYKQLVDSLNDKNPHSFR